jgi:hypothetical protein
VRLKNRTLRNWSLFEEIYESHVQKGRKFAMKVHVKWSRQRRKDKK